MDIWAPETEHDCVAQHPNVVASPLRGLGSLDSDGCAVMNQGIVDCLLDDDVCIAVAVASGETGILNQLPREAGALSYTGGPKGLLVVDAVQVLGRLAFSLAPTNGPVAAIASAHKLGGAKGVGALCTKGWDPAVLLRGGGQEHGPAVRAPRMSLGSRGLGRRRRRPSAIWRRAFGTGLPSLEIF